MYKMVDSNDLKPKPREYLIEKAMKLKAMTESDVEGERESANRLLLSYMDKYDITWQDLDDSIPKEYVMPCQDEYHKKLLIQVVYKNVGGGHCYRMFSSESLEEAPMMKIKCKPADFINIQLDWDFYWVKFQEELDIFYRAFVERNQLFPPKELQRDDDTDDNEELSEEEIRKIQGMMKGIDAYTRAERLESHKEE